MIPEVAVIDQFNELIDRATTRRCDGCSLCCTALEVFDLPGGKPMGQRCPALDACGRCEVYASRPETCRVFYCAWRLSEPLELDVPDELRPADCGFVIHWDRVISPTLMTLFIDPDRPRRWTRYRHALEQLARRHDAAIAIGGGTEATYVLAPSGRWFARADFPELFRGVEVGVPSTEFRRYSE